MSQEEAAGDYRRLENFYTYNDLSQKAVDVDRIASDEYFRIRKNYIDVDSHEKHRNDYYSNYPKQKRPKSTRPRPKYTMPFPNHQWLKNKDWFKVNKAILKGDLKSFEKFVKKLDVQLPNSTLYTIDKVVRDRLREGRFGKDFSEYINLESEEEHKIHYYHQEMLRLGITSIQVPYVPQSEMLSQKLAKSPMLPENRQIKNPSRFKSIRGPKSGKRAKTIAKYGSCRKGNGTMKEDHPEWRMRKRAFDRLKTKLIDQAKDEIRQEILNDMFKVTQIIRPSESNVEEPKEETKEENQPEEQPRVPTFADEEHIEQPKLHFKNFKEFWYMTTGRVYPNPVF